MEKRSIRSAIVGVLLLFAAASTAGSEDPLVYITETGRKYHRGDCRYLELSRIPILLSAAVSVGYEPCGHCNPPPPPPGINPPAESPELYRLNVSGVEEPEQADLTRMTRGVVVRHVDGDTVYVSIPRPPVGLRQYESVRFIGVDAPETVHPQKLVERLGRESSEFTRRYLLYRPVFLAYDWQLRDRYDRLLAYIYLNDGSCFNALLVREGYAHAYTRYPFEFLEQFRALELEAREQDRGLWGSQEK